MCLILWESHDCIHVFSLSCIGDVIVSALSACTLYMYFLAVCTHFVNMSVIICLSLSVALVTLSAVMGYCVAPAPFQLSTLLCASLGTALCSASSLSLNQVQCGVY